MFKFSLNVYDPKMGKKYNDILIRIILFKLNEYNTF